ncbi:hypothetical protein BDP27DRAFT_1370807 [Rhodocollybia butyracea]|uniref:Uncharacterized protein n=1 Tax=Rhodocollybia butyracea TaxID=206335 RepID=A0A9P5PDD3_9AGAR|nr:hypothetical protein BDP27DRAFT_1370807 [Rhodocollybia butyracea]
MPRGSTNAALKSARSIQRSYKDSQKSRHAQKSTNSQRLQCVDSKPGSETETNDEENTEVKKQPVKKRKMKKAKKISVACQLEEDSNESNTLKAFKNVAHFHVIMHSPRIPWLNAFVAGLVRDNIVEKPDRDEDEEEEPKDLESLYPVYDIIKKQMNKTAGAFISEDVQSIKDEVPLWLEDLIKEDLDPRINRGNDKTKTRGWKHLMIGRLLCPPIKLAEFDKDPERFCQQVIINSVPSGPITSGHFPSVFYQDHGVAAAEGFSNIFDGLLFSWPLIMTWVFIFHGSSNAQWYRHWFMDVLDCCAEGKPDRSPLKDKTRIVAYCAILMKNLGMKISLTCFIISGTMEKEFKEDVDKNPLKSSRTGDAECSMTPQARPPPLASVTNIPTPDDSEKLPVKTLRKSAFKPPFTITILAIDCSLLLMYTYFSCSDLLSAAFSMDVLPPTAPSFKPSVQYSIIVYVLVLYH